MKMPSDPEGRTGSFTDKSDPLNNMALEFIEEMMMPGKIWAAGLHEFYGQWCSKNMAGGAEYIRADLTNDLLAALETIHSQTNDGLARRIAVDALIRYRALAN